MGNQNISYKSKEIRAYYCSNRNKWEEFYPSERWVIAKVAGKNKSLGDVLDVGCACGGLGAALNEQFSLDSYTGVDINSAAINWAIREAQLPIPTSFVAGDIVELDLKKGYDVVISLSCADWNVETKKIIDSCWARVKEKGFFIISLRLTTGRGVNDIKTSYQYINFSGKDNKPEIANYVVFNFANVLGLMASLSPSPISIGAYGYWGRPSDTAVTPFDRLVFAVFYLQKGDKDQHQGIVSEFRLPLDLFIRSGGAKE
jgi:SAM-dependent methyltransferase